jgi:hypothetical protein
VHYLHDDIFVSELRGSISISARQHLSISGY